MEPKRFVSWWGQGGLILQAAGSVSVPLQYFLEHCDQGVGQDNLDLLYSTFPPERIGECPPQLLLWFNQISTLAWSYCRSTSPLKGLIGRVCLKWKVHF